MIVHTLATERDTNPHIVNMRRISILIASYSSLLRKALLSQYRGAGRNRTAFSELPTRCPNQSGSAPLAILLCLYAFVSSSEAGQGIPLPSSPLPTGTEQIARGLEIELEIVGANHPELPDFEEGYKAHGGFSVNFKNGGINFARVERGGELLQPILVFHRNWADELPLDARAIGCPANQYLSLDDPVSCFRAILEKMEGGRGPVLLQVRYFSMGQRAATLPMNTVQIPWMYIRHYAKMERTKGK